MKDASSAPGDGEITALLARLRTGDRDAMDLLVPLLYDELRRRAHNQLLAHRPGDTLGTTALVHETYLKLAASRESGYVDRIHFLAVASRAMRQLIVDEARRKLSAKRGGGLAATPLEEHHHGTEQPAEVHERAARLVALDAALDRLADLDTRLARTVELRFFGEMSVEDTAAALDVSPRTVKRDWQKARAFLHAALGDAAEAVAPPAP